MSKVQIPPIRERVLAQLRNIGEDVASRVADGLGTKFPPAITLAKRVLDLPVSNALSILKKLPVLADRCLGILVTDDADGKLVEILQGAAKEVGASVKIIAPKVGGVALKGGKHLAADEKIDDAPSVLFEAVALVISADGAQILMGERAALDFVSGAFAHCKAIRHSTWAKALLDKAGVAADKAVIALPDGVDTPVSHLSSREWSREKAVKMPV